jgi:hypothetical protein
MTPTRKISRRSFMSTVVGGAVVGAAVLTVGTEEAAAQRTGVTNRDPGDPPGRGRTGITNRDPSDRPGYGRYRRAARRCTDRDPGDPANRRC